jgi:hypothetical protein
MLVKMVSWSAARRQRTQQSPVVRQDLLDPEGLEGFAAEFVEIGIGKDDVITPLSDLADAPPRV